MTLLAEWFQRLEYGMYTCAHIFVVIFNNKKSCFKAFTVKSGRIYPGNLDRIDRIVYYYGPFSTLKMCCFKSFLAQSVLH